MHCYESDRVLLNDPYRVARVNLSPIILIGKRSFNRERDYVPGRALARLLFGAEQLMI